MMARTQRPGCWRTLLSLLAVTFMARPALGEDLQMRLGRQAALFDRLARLEAATAGPSAGTARPAHLPDFAVRAALARARQERALRAHLAAIVTDGFGERDRVSHDVALYELDQRLRDTALKDYEMPVSSRGGPFIDLAALPEAAPFATAADYRAYLGRLREVPRALAQVEAAMRRGERDRLVPPRSSIELLPQQCRDVVQEDPFLHPLHLAQTRSARDAAVAGAITTTVTTSVLPAYRRFCAFLADDFVAHARADPSERALPDGARRYAELIRAETTSDLTAAEIEKIGEREVARLNARLEQVARAAGFPDLTSYRRALNRDPAYIPTSAQQIVNEFQRYIDLVRPRLPELFRSAPATTLVIEAMPPGSFPNISHHVDASPDGKSPGKILVAVSDLAQRRTISDETIAFHEGLPGHELQASIAQRIAGLPAFRSQLHYDAYIEGWAVYAEGLGDMLGLFRDDASEYGLLNTELQRALRLVADTGMHDRGWSRAQVVDYLRRSGAEDEPTVQAEADRIAVWPAQGLSYKIGQLRILALRERARARLGARFDIRDFHNVVLDDGPLPLTLLEEKVDRWIDRGGGSAD